MTDDLMRRVLAHAWDIYNECVERGIPATPPMYPPDFCDLPRRERKRITKASRLAAMS